MNSVNEREIKKKTPYIGQKWIIYFDFIKTFIQTDSSSNIMLYTCHDK